MAKKTKTTTKRAQVLVSIPRAGEFTLSMDVPEGLKSKDEVQTYVQNQVVARLKVKILDRKL